MMFKVANTNASRQITSLKEWVGQGLKILVSASGPSGANELARGR